MRIHCNDGIGHKTFSKYVKIFLNLSLVSILVYKTECNIEQLSAKVLIYYSIKISIKTWLFVEKSSRLLSIFENNAT